MNRLLICVLMLSALDAFARRPNSKVPLMPPQNEVLMAEGETDAGAIRPTGLGLELGTLGRPTNTNADAFGLQLLMGGRVFMRFPLTRNFYAKPALGYFRRSEGTSGSGVLQHSLELGGTLQWVPFPERRFRPIVGISPRIEGLVSNISAFDSSASSEMAFRVRTGPSVGFAYSIDRTLNLTADLEVSFSFTNPVRTYSGLTAGFIYRID